MNHHKNELNYCPLCEEKLLNAHDTIILAFRKIKDKFPDCHISWTFRDKIDQETFYREGKTKLQWPKSAHNKNPSEAMDLFQLSDENQAVYNNDYFKNISEYLVMELIPVEWSGVWTHFKEYDHFQLSEET